MNIKQTMPALFIGHGNPMNAITDNSFTQSLALLGETLPLPKAILCISAHWLTDGTFLTGMMQPKTIHDFYGFPKQLFDVNYPAPGSLTLAEQTQLLTSNYNSRIDFNEWGLDHGTWAVLNKMYPEANVPVVQLSIDYKKPLEHHLKIAQQLKILRSQGVLILGSGNIVHNLGKINWNLPNKAETWAEEFDKWFKENLEARNFEKLAKNYDQKNFGKLSVPTPDHYIPALYTAGVSNADEQLTYSFEGFDMGSISMRCFKFG